MMSTRAATRTAGILFVVADLAGFSAAFLEQPVRDDPLVLSTVAAHRATLTGGATAELVMGLACVAIAVVLYPVLRGHGERLALGYVVSRTIEGGLYALSVVGLLTLVSISRDAPPAAQQLAELAGTARDWTNDAVLYVPFALSAAILSAALYRPALVPRWLSGSGIVGALLYLGTGVAAMYGVKSGSAVLQAGVVPLALQELVLAIWLIVRGVNERVEAAPSRSDALTTRHLPTPTAMR